MCRMCGNSAWAYACLGNLTCGCLHVLANLHTCALCVHMCGVFAVYCVHSCVLTNDTCMSTCVCLHERINVACICTAWERAMRIHICVFHNQLRDRWLNVSTCTARPIFQCIVNHTIIHNTNINMWVSHVSCAPDVFTPHYTWYTQSITHCRRRNVCLYTSAAPTLSFLLPFFLHISNNSHICMHVRVCVYVCVHICVHFWQDGVSLWDSNMDGNPSYGFVTCVYCFPALRPRETSRTDLPFVGVYTCVYIRMYMHECICMRTCGCRYMDSEGMQGGN